MRQLRRLVKTESPRDVAAFYEKHGPALAPLLRGRDRVFVADMMHVVDAATGWKPTPEMLHPHGTNAGEPAVCDAPVPANGVATPRA